MLFHPNKQAFIYLLLVFNSSYYITHMNSRHLKYFNLLQKIAEANEPVARARTAACLVYQNRIISVGWNKAKTHPLAKRYSKHPEALFSHAEIDCIANATRARIDENIISKASMYVLRIKADGTWANAKPCKGCQMMIKFRKFNHVRFTTDTGMGSL